jgi:O-methyltransferase
MSSAEGKLPERSARDRDRFPRTRATRRAARSLVEIVRRARVGRLVRRVEPHLPEGIRGWVAARRSNILIEAGVDFPEGVLVPVEELESTYREALELLIDRHGRDGLGDYLEFGVFGGASLGCMHRATEALGLTDVRLFGFDSFEGLPPVAEEEARAAGWEAGQFAFDEEAARENLTEQGVDWSRVKLVKGWFDETLTPELVEREAIRKASVVMVDCDLYASAKVALDFCRPLIRDEAVLCFDDWWPDSLAAHDMGEKRAFDEFLAEADDFDVTELGSYNPKAARVFLVSRRT